MTSQQFLTILALTESNNNPNASLGDHGRALGRFQVHPDWVWTWAMKSGIYPKLNETWDGFVTRLVEFFFNDHQEHFAPSFIAMYFHLGHATSPGQSDWDKKYEDRFNGYSDQVMHGT